MVSLIEVKKKVLKSLSVMSLISCVLFWLNYKTN